MGVFQISFPLPRSRSRCCPLPSTMRLRSSELAGYGHVCITQAYATATSFHVPMTVGSRSTKTARGTCLPAPVSLKNVLNESSPPPIVLSLGICPSGWMPCSRQYSSQQALPICTPAWPTWMLIHSRCKRRQTEVKTPPLLTRDVKRYIDKTPQGAVSKKIID